MDVKEIRAANLARYIKQYAKGSQAAFARQYGMNPAHLSQLLPGSRYRDIGDKLAREIEQKLGLEHGEMDRLPAASSDPLLAQLLNFYAQLSMDGRDALLGAANRLYVLENPERSSANPFPGAKPTEKPKRKNK